MCFGSSGMCMCLTFRQSCNCWIVPGRLEPWTALSVRCSNSNLMATFLNEISKWMCSAE
uniref:Uncharacterized protein n=1 Tax=Arundo donax TaxID=35708 RepID=A0A0A9Q7J7_ARUDO